MVHSFCEMTKFLLLQPNAGYILSERFNQDSIESLSGQQRSRGHRNDNPSVQQFMQNTGSWKTYLVGTLVSLM